MSTGWIIALCAGAAVIAGLSFYLGRLLMQIRQAQAKRDDAVKQRNDKLGSDIHTIAWAMRDGQCDYSEGVLRVWVLLDHLVEEQPKNYETRYPGIFALYDKIKNMPTHEARKQQDKLERLKMDAERLSFEEKYTKAIKTDIDKLIERFKS